MVLIFAHRGMGQGANENTILSFQRAIEAGADGIELDVHESKDGELVVMHDATVNRTTNGRGAVKNMTYADIEQLDAGEGEHPPKLEDAIVLCSKADKLLNIEIKAPNIEKKVVNLVLRHNMQNEVIISSFGHDYLKKVKEIHPDLKTATLVPNTPISAIVRMITKLLQSDQHAYIAQAAAVNANAINPLFTTCTEKFVRLAGQKGLEVYPWTVDVVSRARDLIKWDVTGIITNKPELLIKELNA